MTRQSSISCRDVEAALLGGATRDRSAGAAGAGGDRPGAASHAGATQRAAIKVHLAACADCVGLQRALASDAAALRHHLDTTGYLPVANRVFAALPRVDAEREIAGPGTGVVSDRSPTSPAPAIWTLPASQASRRDNLAVGASDESAGPATGRSRPWPNGSQPVLDRTRRTWRPGGRIGTAVQATCLILLGLGLGVGVQQAWPRLDIVRSTEQPGPTVSAGTGEDRGYAALPASGTLAAIDGDTGDSAYVPAPGDNPPLAVPGSGAADRISGTQNQDTWQTVQESASALAPLLYPPIPPGSFESVTVGRVGPEELIVRYSGSGMRLTVEAGAAATDDVSVSTTSTAGAQQFQTTVRGQPATVTITQASTTDFDPDALAPGLNLTVTWTEPGATLDPAGSVRATTIPYAVTAAGVPVDVVMAFAGSLVPLVTGWDTLLDSQRDGNAPILPATMPAGFGPGTLLSPATGPGPGSAATDTTSSWTIASSRAGTATTSDLIVFTGGSAATGAPATGTTSAIVVAGHPGTVTTNGTAGTAGATWEIRWQADGTSYRITLTGPGITAAEVQSLIDGLLVGLDRAPVAGRNAVAPELIADRAA